MITSTMKNCDHLNHPSVNGNKNLIKCSSNGELTNPTGSLNQGTTFMRRTEESYSIYAYDQDTPAQKTDRQNRRLASMEVRLPSPERPEGFVSDFLRRAAKKASIFSGTSNRPHNLPCHSTLGSTAYTDSFHEQGQISERDSEVSGLFLGESSDSKTH